MIGSRWMQRIAPWKWMPLIVFLTLQVRLSDVVHIAGAYLIIPVGAHLARRYGRSGFMVLALSALPLAGQVSFGSISTTHAPGVYLAALLISWFVQKHPPEQIKIPQLRLTPWVVICLFILPLHIGLGSSDILWFEDVHWMADGVTLFYLLIFVLGVSRVAMQPVLIALTLAVFLGIMLEYARLPLDAAQWLQARRAELPWFGLTDLRSFYGSYRFDSPAELLTAFGFLRFGRFLADQHCRGDDLSLPSPMHRMGLISAVLFLALGGEINDYLLPRDNPALHWFGSFYAILLAGMLAGFCFRFAGILLMLFMVTGFCWLDAVLRADLNIIRPFFYFNIDDFLYAYGFGLLGLGMRDVLARTSSRLWCREWFLYLGLYLVVLFSVIPLEGAYDLFIILMAFFAGIALTLGANRIRKRLAKTEIALTGGWLSLVCLLMMGYLLYHFSKERWQDVQTALQQVAGMVGQLLSAKKAMDEEDLMMVGFFAGGILTGFWLLTSTLAGLLKSITQLTADLRVVLQRLRSKVPMILKFKSRKDAASPNSSGKFPMYVSNVLSWTNRAMLAAFISLFILLTTYNVWVDYQDDQARLARYRNTSASLSEERLQQQKEREKARADVAARLTLAAQGVLKDYPNVNVDRNDYRIKITSGWYTTPAESKIRRRVYITIRPVAKFNDMHPEKSLRQSITVNLYRQDRGRFNLWVEHSPSRNWQDKQALEKELKEAIVTAVIEKSQTFTLP